VPIHEGVGKPSLREHTFFAQMYGGWRMRVSGCRFWSLVGAIGFSIGFTLSAGAVPSASTSHKVIIYPGPGDSIDQLKQQGVEKVDNYGSYWVAEVGDRDLAKVRATFGNRVVPANNFNRIELRTASINTMGNGLVIPAGLEQVESPGRRLRIVQFKGPIQSEWLAKLRNLSGVKVVNYVPNNAYLVWLDQPAEDNLCAMKDANGPIQWIGPYHPYYKIQPGLLNADSQAAESPVSVRVALVNGPDAGQTINGMEKFGFVQGSYDLGDQKVAAVTVPASAIARIARLSDVIWIEKVERKVLLDEVQDLIVAAQTNGPGNGPSTTVGITNYLDFLINSVSGGLASFTNQLEYPIVDVADTGFDATLEEYPGTALQPSFNEFGVPFATSRLAYQEPGTGGYFAGAGIDNGCAALNLNFFGTEDFYDHGTRVASVIAGYDTQTNVFNELSIFSTIVTQDFTVSFNCSGTGAVTNHFIIPTSPCALVTDIIFSCTSAGPFNTILPLPTEITVTQVVNSIHQDPSGFHFGLGVSPFGRVGSSRIWRQSADTTGNPPHVRFLPSPQPILNCMNGLYPVLFFAAYTEGGRIQNDSWSEDITDTGDNGGRYTADSQTYDIGVRDALLVGQSNNVPGPSPLNQEFIVVFAGNSLLTDAGVRGNNGGFGDLRITAPATAKNVVTVIASENVRLDGSGCAGNSDQDNSFDMWEDSAFGPTIDGRFKPEIVAPGTTIYAAKTLLSAFIDPVNGITPSIAEDPSGNLGAEASLSGQITNLYCAPPQFFTNFFPNTSATIVVPGPSGFEYDCRSGSSYAAPAVSGAIQLLWWYFQHRLNDELGTQLLQPSPAMAKAYLCNSARYLSITNPATGASDTLPSIAQGMGELDLQRMFDQVPRVLRDESTPRAIDVALITTNPAAQQTYFSQSGQSYEVSGQVFDPTKPFRVSLAWTDAAGAPLAAKELVNDLDLQVTIGGVIYKGNVFSEDHSVPGGNFDNVNNMESVFLPAGQTGTWSVIVRAVNIAGDGVPNVGGSNDQDFALVVYNAASTNRSDVPNLSTNNDCQTALILTQFPFSFSNTLSKAVYTGKTMPNPTAGRGGVEEFFRIVQPTPGTTFKVNTQGTAFNTILSVWTVQVLPETVFVRGNCGALTELISTNGGFNSQVSFIADGSNDYYIVAEPLNNGAGGNFVLNVNASSSPISVTPSSLVFGAQVILTASGPQTVTYLDGATVPVNITDLEITGPNAADFSLSAQTCKDSILAPGQNCFVSVVFTPQAGPLGLRQANLVFTDNATGSPRIVPLSGTATPAAPVICLSSGLGTLTFGSQLLTTTSAVQSITLTNCGSAALNISSVAFGGFASNDFSVAQTCTSGPIAPGGTCTLNVTFEPQAVGTRNATLVITDDAAGSPTVLSVTGVGVALAPAICFGRTSVDFPNTVAGFTSSVQTLIITNCGTATLLLTNLTITGANPGDFLVTLTTCGTILTGNTCQVNLEFTPTAGGPRSASLGIWDNISGSPQLLPLTGNGGLSQPDAAIGRTVNVKRMVGAGIENSTGAGQEVLQPIHRGARRPVRFYVALENVGASPDSFTVRGDGNSTGFTVNYYLGAIVKDSTNVSSAVESGVFSTSTLAPSAFTGDSTMMRVEVFADKTLVGKGVTKTFNIRFASASDPSKVDVVKATVKTR
jgi:Subtilase family/Abnormal spindle-like microcephaly-assoc'd, ASPM-SPD-2-Hydin